MAGRNPPGALVLQAPGACPVIPNVGYFYAKSAGCVYKQHSYGLCVISKLVNGAHALLGCNLARDFVWFAENIGVSIGGVDGLQPALKRTQAPFRVRHLPSDAH